MSNICRTYVDKSMILAHLKGAIKLRILCKTKIVIVTENNWVATVRQLLQLMKYSNEELCLKGWLVMTTTSWQLRTPESKKGCHVPPSASLLKEQKTVFYQIFKTIKSDAFFQFITFLLWPPLRL